MSSTGPQIYPGAVHSGASWYQDNYGGDSMEVNVVLLHTTEGTNLPDYGGGGSAPNITAVPDFAAKKLNWYQHFNVDTSARALVNKAGGVETNINNVNQVELVGTCDPTTHAKWASAGRAHIYWPEAPDWALVEVARYIAWMNLNHGVPLVAAKTWLPYPKSAGNSAARFTNAQWNAFKGVCGHQHAAENEHGDPGNIDIDRIMYVAKTLTGVSMPSEPAQSTEDEVPNNLNEANAIDVELEPLVWTALAFQGDGILYAGPVSHNTTVTLYFDTGTPDDTKIQGRFYLTNTDNTGKSDYLVIDHDGGGGHQFMHSVPVPAGKRLWFEVRAVPASGGDTTKLLHRMASGPYWAG